MSEKTNDEKNGKEDDYVTVRIPKELSKEADKLIGKKGFKNKAEIVSEALRELLDQYGADKHFQMLNRTSDGVKVRDVRLRPSSRHKNHPRRNLLPNMRCKQLRTHPLRPRST